MDNAITFITIVVINISVIHFFLNHILFGQFNESIFTEVQEF